eukprot:534384-Prymnesium_polylepis.2
MSIRALSIGQCAQTSRTSDSTFSVSASALVCPGAGSANFGGGAPQVPRAANRSGSAGRWRRARCRAVRRRAVARPCRPTSPARKTRSRLAARHVRAASPSAARGGPRGRQPWAMARRAPLGRRPAAARRRTAARTRAAAGARRGPRGPRRVAWRRAARRRGSGLG